MATECKTEGHIPMMEKETIDAASVSAADHSDPAFATKLKATMDEWGFAIITDLLSADEIKALEGQFVKDLASIVELKDEEAQAPEFLSDPLKLWPTAKGGKGPFNLGKFGCSDFGLIHGDFAWSVRRHPKVIASYEAMYPGHEGKLCCGMDQLFFGTKPAEKVNDDRERSNLWWPHTDLNRYYKPSGDYACFQGIVYLWASGEDKSTTVIYPKSHTDVYEALMKDNEALFKNREGHFSMHPTENHEALSHRLRRVTMPAGSMLLFTSRTTHQGWAGGERLAAPVCWEPKELRDEAALERKKEAVLTGISTTHWASLGITHPCTGTPEDGGDGKVLLKHRAHLGCLTKDAATGKVSIKQDILDCL